MRSSSRPTVAVVALAFVLLGSPRLRSGVKAQQPSKAEAVSVLRPARVFDGQTMQAGWAVRVRGDKIDAAGPAASIDVSGATTIDMPGTTLIPGLVEGHSHVLLHPYNETTLERSGAARGARRFAWRAPTNHLRATLMAGFTTIRDLGTEGAAVRRRRAEAGGGAGDHSRAADARQRPARSSRPAATGRRASRSNGACRRGRRKRTATTLIRVVRDQIGHGADWIKVYADYRWGAHGEAAPTFSRRRDQS